MPALAWSLSELSPRKGVVARGSRYQDGSGLCLTRRYSRRILSGMPLIEPAIVVTHSDCVCNEVLALSCRHQAMVPTATRSVEHLSIPEDLLTEIKPWSHRKVVEYYGGTKRQEFERAYVDLQCDPLEAKDGRVRMFLKADKYECGDVFKVKAPRCIQFRSKRYGLELGRYIHPMEVDLYAEVVDCSGTQVFAKARNTVQRAQDLRVKSEEFSDPVYLLLDQSNWDAHVNKTLLSIEHFVYMEKCRDRKLNRLLGMQLFNKGSTKNGTRYETQGTRMSGDMNTAVGNCIINYVLLYNWARDAGIKACFYVDGDDSVLVFDSKDLARMEQLDPTEWFLQWGMESKVELEREFEKCEFCQSRPVWDGLGWRMVRNPARFLLRSEWTVMPHSEAFIPRLVSSIGRCELACGLGVPVIQALAWKMVQAGGIRHRLWTGIDSWRKARMEAWLPDKAERAMRVVTDESRASFERAWGIGPVEQRRMEAATLTLSGTTPSDWELYLGHFAGDNVAWSRDVVSK